MGHLLALLEEAWETIPETIRRAESLTTYATATRYPNVDKPVSEQEYAEAVEIATTVVRWAEKRL